MNKITKFAIFALLITVAVLYYFIAVKSGKKIDNTLPANSPTPTVAETLFELYFGDKNNKAESEECLSKSTVKRRMDFSITAPKDAIDELLKGPSDKEQAEGIYTNISKGVLLQKFTLEDGVARVDFNSKLEEGIAGSCKVIFIRSQIEQTLKQFQGVNEVVISINGRTDDILQP